MLNFACFTWQKNFRNTSRMFRFEKQIVEHRGAAAGSDIPGVALPWTCSPEGILLLRHYFIFGHLERLAVLFLISSFFPVVLTHDVLKKARGNLEVSEIFACIEFLGFYLSEIHSAVSGVFCRVSLICFRFAP